MDLKPGWDAPTDRDPAGGGGGAERIYSRQSLLRTLGDRRRIQRRLPVGRLVHHVRVGPRRSRRSRRAGVEHRHAFCAELDSLVDVISFGVAPALIIYFEDFATLGRFALGALLPLCHLHRPSAGALQRAEHARWPSVGVVHRPAVAGRRHDAGRLLCFYADRVVSPDCASQFAAADHGDPDGRARDPDG